MEGCIPIAHSTPENVSSRTVQGLHSSEAHVSDSSLQRIMYYSHILVQDVIGEGCMGSLEDLRAREYGCIPAVDDPRGVIMEAMVVLPLYFHPSSPRPGCQREYRGRCECVVSRLRVRLPGSCTRLQVTEPALFPRQCPLMTGW